MLDAARIPLVFEWSKPTIIGAGNGSGLAMNSVAGVMGGSSCRLGSGLKHIVCGCKATLPFRFEVAVIFGNAIGGTTGGTTGVVIVIKSRTGRDSSLPTQID